MILASLENKSEHPIAKAILDHARANNIALAEVTNFSAIEGQGLKATIKDIEYYAGNLRLINELGLKFDSSQL